MQQGLRWWYPEAAKIHQGCGSMIEENGELQRRFVRLGKHSSETMTIVLSGLNVGDTVINPPNTEGK